MKTGLFFLELNRRARATTQIEDPLALATLYLRDHASTGEGRALSRLIRALTGGIQQIPESDLWSFSSQGLDLAAALLLARMEGRYSQEEWAQCVPPYSAKVNSARVSYG
jgi:hypothetical protein